MSSREDAKALVAEYWPDVEETLALMRESAITRQCGPLAFAMAVAKLSIEVFNYGEKARSNLSDKEREERL